MIHPQLQNIVDMLSIKRAGDQIESISIKEGLTGIQEIEFRLLPKEQDCKRIIGITGRDMSVDFGVIEVAK